MKAKSDIKDRFVIIMAGGRGERFWPLSREKMPKQLLTLLGKRSFLQQAVDRVLPLVPAKNIFVITNEAQLPEVRKQLPKIPKSNLVAEPVGRDTCAAVTLGAALVGARSTTGVMAVLPADHVIPDEKNFQQVLGDAFDLAGRGQAIVTIGIKPTEPSTGYGYIQVGEALPPPQGAKKYKTTFFRAEQFVEKPYFEKALEYVNSGQYRCSRIPAPSRNTVSATNPLPRGKKWSCISSRPAAAAMRLANLNVTVAGGRLRRLDADGHNRPAAAGQVKCVGQDLLEFLRVGNDVVGGQHRHDAGGGTRAHQRRAERDGGAGVAAHRLGDEVVFGNFREAACAPRRIAPRW